MVWPSRHSWSYSQSSPDRLWSISCLQWWGLHRMGFEVCDTKFVVTKFRQASPLDNSTFLFSWWICSILGLVSTCDRVARLPPWNLSTRNKALQWWSSHIQTQWSTISVKILSHYLALTVYMSTVVASLVLSFGLGVLPLGWIFDNYLPMASASIITSFALGFYLYISSFKKGLLLTHEGKAVHHRFLFGWFV